MISSPITLFAVAFLSVPVLTAQGVVSPFPAPAAPQGDATRITLDVVVNDKSGRPVSGLDQQDFTVLDGKQPQKILSFEAVTKRPADRDPVQVILVVDSVNTEFGRVAYEREQIKRFLRRDDGKLALPVSIAFLSDKGLNMQGQPSQDGNALVAYLDQNEPTLRQITRSQGFYGADDRTHLSVSAVDELADAAARIPGRKIVIVVSPGWPILSGPNIQLTRKEQEGIFRTIVALSTKLRESGITLYSVDPLGTGDAGTFRTFYYAEFLKGVKSPNQVMIGDLALQVLAVQSGGRVLNSDNDLAGEIERCVRDADSYYVLSIAPLPADGPDDYHPIEVKIDKPKLKAQTRAGYYAEPVQPNAP